MKRSEVLGTPACAAALAAALSAALATGAALPATAGPDRLSLLVGSSHIGARQPFEEVNPGLFLTWEGARFDRTLGAFRNSYGRVSVAATAALPLLSGPDWRIDAFLGTAYYPEDGRDFRVSVGDWVPLGGLQARKGPVFVQLIPQDGNVADAVIAFGLTLPLTPQ